MGFGYGYSSQGNIHLDNYDEILRGIDVPELKGQIHDLSHVFDEPGREDYRDNVHFKDDGHQAVADAMYPVVINAIREIRPSPQRDR